MGYRYTPHTWIDGELITAEKLNAIEEAIKNEQAGPQGEKGEKGEPGEGLTGQAEELTVAAPGANTAAVLDKVNEIIRILNARGVSSAPEGA